MFHLDNSETSWLVYADWLEDQNIDATHIRESLAETDINDWCCEYKLNGVGRYGLVGGHSGRTAGVGVIALVGGHGELPGGFSLVGG